MTVRIDDFVRLRILELGNERIFSAQLEVEYRVGPLMLPIAVVSLGFLNLLKPRACLNEKKQGTAQRSNESNKIRIRILDFVCLH